MPLTYVDFNMNFLLTKTPNLCKNLIKFVDLMSCSNTKKRLISMLVRSNSCRKLFNWIELLGCFDGCNQMRDWFRLFETLCWVVHELKMFEHNIRLIGLERSTQSKDRTFFCYDYTRFVFKSYSLKSHLCTKSFR